MECLLVSQAEAAKALAVSETTVWRLYKAGDLETVRIGSRTLITSASVRAYVERRTVSPNTTP